MTTLAVDKTLNRMNGDPKLNVIMPKLMKQAISDRPTYKWVK
jgi:hypothetical protein